MHQTQFSEKIPYGGFSQIRSQIFIGPVVVMSIKIAISGDLGI